MKQQKVLNKIKRSMESGRTTPLGTKPNDECYTAMQDILDEMGYWAGLDKFKGKKIICPCDWDIVEGEEIYSITIDYNDEGVEVVGNGIKKLPRVVVDLWSQEEERFVEIELKENEIDGFLSNKLTCNFVRTFVQKARVWGIKSITASGYNPAIDRGIKFQDIDYSKYDICCTNPPFSLYGEFMKTIVGKIDFIVLAPFLNRVTPNVGGYLFRKEAYLGCNVMAAMNFYNPTNKNSYKTKSVAVDWITSFPEAQDERNKELEHKKSYIDYETYKDDFPVMENMVMKDGTCAIRVATTQIPDNYYGWMFGSIQFLHEYDLRQFEWYPTSLKKQYNAHPETNPFKGKASDSVLDHKGKRMFHGIVFRRKQK